MSKKVIAFDLDDTLAITKSPITDEMSEILGRVLEHYDVCVISGGNFEQFKKQVVERLEIPTHKLNRLHLMPTCGTRYYRYDELNKVWKIQYAENLSEEEKKQITDIVEKVARGAGLWPVDPFGEVIEDRGSQISISFLGQQAPAEKKYEWAQKHSNDRLKVRDTLAEQLQEFEVRAGGSTTIDITRLGIDKAYGMKKLCEAIEISKDEILFIGDKLQEGGNDYPVKAMGIQSIEVRGHEDTIYVLEGVLGTT
jgi:HAD superfamily hydrolase (TIGR01484 family)